MPRGFLKEKEYALTDIVGVIRQEMSKQGINQSEVAKQIGISQPALSQKLKSEKLSIRELIVISRYLKLPAAKMGRLICGEE